MHNRLSIGWFIFGVMFLGLIWWAFKPVIDLFVDLIPGVEGVTETEIVYFAALPFLIAGVLLGWLFLRFLRGRGEGGD